MNYTKIDSDAGLQLCLNNWELNKVRIIGIDIEAENNLHRYGEKLCLIQVFDGNDKIIIDPLKIDMALTRKLFESKNILKIFYDAGSDLSLLKNGHDIEIKSILDLRPAVELLDYEKKDLHSVIEADLNISLDKKKKYQKYNWNKRPLPDDVIEYALNDVIHLFNLKTAIYSKLIKKNLMDEFILRNILIQTKDYQRSIESKYEKIFGYKKLNKTEKIKVRKIHDIRDKYAKKINLPPNHIIANRKLFDLVRGSISIDELIFPKRMNRKSIVKELKKVAID